MIRQLRGTIAHCTEHAVIIDVQGVGYLVHTIVPGNAFKLGDTIILYTYLAVKDTALDLYGFQLLDELEIFELLIGLPKIGPKSAQHILMQADIELLKQSVANDDPKYLSKMSGIGKKSAEKIVMGLKEKFERMPTSPIDTPTATDGATHTGDTIDALIALGYPPHDARKAVQQLPPDITNTNEAVRAALKFLS